MNQFWIFFIPFLIRSHAQACTDTSPTPSPNISNEIGTECSKNLSNIWLDVAVLIDVSLSMQPADINNIFANLATIFTEVNIAQSGPNHHTRIGIIFYNNSAYIHSNMTQYTSNNDFYNDLINMPNPSSSEPAVDIQQAIKKASDMLDNTTRNARKVVLLYAAAYDLSNDHGACDTANTLKAKGYFFIAVDYSGGDNTVVEALQCISSNGMFFQSIDGGALVGEISDALCQANCLCPPGTQQFFVYTNVTRKTGKYFADCIQGVQAGSYVSYAEKFCHKDSGYNTTGTLVSFTSLEKENFTITQVVPHDLPSTSGFHIGLHRTNPSSGWGWYDYNNESLFPLGDYTNWATGMGSSQTGDCVLANSVGKEKFQWTNEACTGNIASYVCQMHACDADHECNLSWLN